MVKEGMGLSEGPQALWSNTWKTVYPYPNRSQRGSEDDTHRFSGPSFQSHTKSSTGGSPRNAPGSEGNRPLARLRTSHGVPSTSHVTPKMLRPASLTGGACRSHHSLGPSCLLSSAECGTGGMGLEEKERERLGGSQTHRPRLKTFWTMALATADLLKNETLHTQADFRP